MSIVNEIFDAYQTEGSFQQLFQVYNDLKRKHTNVLQTLASATYSVKGQRATYENALKDLAARIARLDPNQGDLGQQLLAGQFAPRKYADLLKTYWDSLAYYENEITGSSVSFERVWGELVVPTWNEAKTSVIDTVGAVGDSAFPIGLVIVVILVLVLAIKLV